MSEPLRRALKLAANVGAVQLSDQLMAPVIDKNRSGELTDLKPLTDDIADVCGGYTDGALLLTVRTKSGRTLRVCIPVSSDLGIQH